MTYHDGTPYSETDTRTKLINPALYDAGWTEDHIQRERSPGTVLVDASGRGKRDTERVDDLLCLPIRDAQIPLPIGVIEAKAANKPYKLGLTQAKEYAHRLNVPFVFSSNGFKCSFYNDFTGITLDINLDTFPSPTELRQIYEEKTSIHLDSIEALPLLMPYRARRSRPCRRRCCARCSATSRDDIMPSAFPVRYSGLGTGDWEFGGALPNP